jgi:pimeloyl-ACP methyl ester carboxylesterase
MLSEWDRLGAYSGAALLVSGAVDIKYSEMALRMASVFANGEAVVLGGGGHRVPAELPEKLARTVSDFLAVKRVLPDAPGFVVSSACGTNLRKS